MTTEAPAPIDIDFVRGDADDMLFTITDDADTPAAINLSVAVDGTVGRPAIIRFAAKRAPATEKNAVAFILKRSYDADEVEVLDQSVPATKGQVIVRVDKPDTSSIPPGVYAWDIEVTRQDDLRAGASAGTLALVAGSPIVAGSGTALLNAVVGDVVHVTNGANAGRASLITRIHSDGSMQTERSWESTQASATFQIRRGRSQTAARGRFTLLQDVVA